MAVTYSVSQIIGKTLIARRHIELYRGGNLGIQAFASVAPGQPVGVVDSYVGGTGGVPLYWMFVDGSGIPYFARHGEGYFDINSLQQQGALTVQEQQAAESETVVDTVLAGFGDIAKYGLMLFAGVALFKVLRNGN